MSATERAVAQDDDLGDPPAPPSKPALGVWAAFQPMRTAPAFANPTLPAVPAPPPMRRFDDAPLKSPTTMSQHVVVAGRLTNATPCRERASRAAEPTPPATGRHHGGHHEMLPREATAPTKRSACSGTRSPWPRRSSGDAHYHPQGATNEPVRSSTPSLRNAASRHAGTRSGCQYLARDLRKSAWSRCSPYPVALDR
jgi:hypothetical protein